MPSRKIEQQLEALKLLRGLPVDEAALRAMRKALSDRVNVVVAKAAVIAAESRAQAVIPDLLEAFDRFFENPVEGDPKCWAKEALAKALRDLDHDESAAFLRGLRHVQMEPIWGKHVDTAGTLRGVCLLALLQCTDLTREEKLWHVMRALTDREPGVRADAARALQELSGREAALLLRMKARMGDREASVTGQTLQSLLGVEGCAGIPFVVEFLTASDEELREEAALALGASRIPEAVTALIDAWVQGRGVQTGEALLRGISASRQESALEFLLELIRTGSEREAQAGLAALQVHRESIDIRKRVAEAVKSRERSIQEEFRARFPQI